MHTHVQSLTYICTYMHTHAYDVDTSSPHTYTYTYAHAHACMHTCSHTRTYFTERLCNLGNFPSTSLHQCLESLQEVQHSNDLAQ